MPAAWQVGYKWMAAAFDPQAGDVGMDDAMEAEGIEFGTPEFKLFLDGSDAAERELS